MARLEEYPYRLWANGEWHRLERGTDYTIKTTSIRIMLSNYAREHGKTVQARKIESDIFEIRMYEGGPLCQFCEEPFDKRGTAQKFCESCVPQGDTEAKHRFQTYRMPHSAYLRLLAELEDGLCPICQLWKANSVDHDHKCCDSTRRQRIACGQCNRGLLCSGCNLNMDRYDSTKITWEELPEPARAYLLKWGGDIGRHFKLTIED